MKKLITTIKTHPVVTILIIVISLLVLSRQNSFPIMPFGNNSFAQMDYKAMPMMSGEAIESYGTGGIARSMSADSIAPAPDQYAPTPSSNRIVIQDTYLSMVVNQVADTVKNIEQVAVKHGGFLVDSSVTVPEGASSGSITIRVESDQRSQALEEIKQLGVRVVSESVSGNDVTDQYEDLEEQLRFLNASKAKFEAILTSSVEVSDILQVNRELLNLQRQIDSVKGRQQYLEKSASLTKISIYLSTDELALPYAPDQVWRPSVVFKEAVRSLIASFRSAVNGLIWISVYAAIWVPVAIIGFLVYRFWNRKK